MASLLSDVVDSAAMGKATGWQIVLVVLSGVAGAQTPATRAVEPEVEAPSIPPHRDLRITAYAENDNRYFRPGPVTDRWYTHGTMLTISHRPQWAEDLARWMPLAERFGPARTAGGYLVGQLIFTPEDTDAETLIRDDRPYAGYLYGGAFWQRANATTFDHVQIEIGTIGPASQADRVQNGLHRLTDRELVNGWAHQLDDELTFQLYARRKWRFELGRFDLGELPIAVQVIPQAGLAAGTVHRFVEGGATLRAGFNLPDDFGPGRLADIAAATGGPPADGWGAYVFARAGGRLVEHNLLLEGNTCKASHDVEARTAVGEVQLGLSVQYHRGPWTVDFGYSQTFSSREFYGQDHSHAWGAYMLSVAYRF